MGVIAYVLCAPMQSDSLIPLHAKNAGTGRCQLSEDNGYRNLFENLYLSYNLFMVAKKQ